MKRSLCRKALVLLALGLGRAHAADDVADPIFRYGGVTSASNPSGAAESVDPATGTLSIAHTELVLPGSGGFNFELKRVYRSKVWGRVDAASPVTANIAAKERSPMGWGWSMHVGRLRNPLATGLTGACAASFPSFETPDGQTITFYKGPGAPWWLSKNHWAMGPCGTNQYCVWSDRAVRYEFNLADTYYYDSQVSEPNRIVPARAIVGPDGQTITASYVAGSGGAMSTITDSVGRVLTFSYDAATRRITRLDYALGGTQGNATWRYNYTPVATASWGTQAFLTSVTPPAGPGWTYGYNTAGTIGTNQYALSSFTWPAGATLSYTYGPVSFNTGYQLVTFSPVLTRVQGGRAPAGTWSYAYASTLTDPIARTTITRPDGRRDVHEFRSWAGITQGHGWRVGLRSMTSLADGADVEESTWGQGSLVWDSPNGPVGTGAAVPAPNWGGCDPVNPLVDQDIYTENLVSRLVRRDGLTYRTDFSGHDAYGQPATISEFGPQGLQRSTTLTYAYQNAYGLVYPGGATRIVRGLKTSETLTDAQGSVASSWGYDFAGRVLTETRAGVTTTYEYDGLGNLSRVLDADNKYVRLQEYQGGRPTLFDFNGAYTTSQTVSALGWTLSQTNGRGHVTAYEYDAAGRTTMTRPPAGAAIQTSYDPAGTTVTAARVPSLGPPVVVSVETLDGFGRAVAQRDGTNAQTTTTYDALGRVTFRSYPHFTGQTPVRGDTFTFDALGRNTGVTHSDGTSAQTSRSVSSMGLVVMRTNERNQFSYLVLTAFGSPDTERVYRVRDSDLTESIVTYDTFGHVVAVDIAQPGDPNSNYQRTFSYDTRGYLIGETTAERGTVTYGRTALGKLTRVTDARGTTVFDLDPLGRVRVADYPGTSSDTTFLYDHNGNVRESASPAGGSHTYGHDAADRVTSHVFTLDGVTYTSAVSFDEAGCPTTVTYPTGMTLTTTCDALNRPTGIAGWAWTVTYHPSGALAAYTNDNGTSVSLMQDDRGRLNRIVAGSVIDVGYSFDPGGNVQTMNTSLAGHPFIGRSMGYDRLDRLTDVFATTGDQTYAYDYFGNRTRKTLSGATTTYAYSAGRLAHATGVEPETFTWHPLGELLTRGAVTYTWDPLGRLTGISDGSSFTYGTDGKRVKRTTALGTEVLHYGPGGRLMSVTRANGAKLRDYVYLGQRLLGVHGKPD